MSKSQEGWHSHQIEKELHLKDAMNRQQWQKASGERGDSSADAALAFTGDLTPEAPGSVSALQLLLRCISQGGSSPERKQNRLVLSPSAARITCCTAPSTTGAPIWLRGWGSYGNRDNTTAINAFSHAPSSHLYSSTGFRRTILLPPVCEKRPKAGRNSVFPLKGDARQQEQLALAVQIIVSLSGRLFSAFCL